MKAQFPRRDNDASSGSNDRPVRNGELHEILDQEFSRCYRFEGLSDFVHDIKGLFRHFVDRRDRIESEEMLKSTFDRT
ncbi:MAG: hypothetical protein ACKVX7_12225 [Planctomycetota bacterium]